MSIYIRNFQTSNGDMSSSKFQVLQKAHENSVIVYLKFVGSKLVFIVLVSGMRRSRWDTLCTGYVTVSYSYSTSFNSAYEGSTASSVYVALGIIVVSIVSLYVYNDV